MKAKFLSLFFMSAIALASNAQISITPTTSTMTPPAGVSAVQAAENGATTAKSVAANPAGGVGTLISQLTQNINTTALTDDFNKAKSTFTSQAKSATDAKSQAGLLQKLEAGLKTSSLSSGWAAIKTKWLSGVKTATTTQQVAGYLKTLSENINTSSLSANWAKVKPAFTAELQKLTGK